MLRVLIIFFISTFFLSPMHGQMLADDLLQGKDKVNVPFIFRNGFIILDLKFNDFMPMSFIFDTGAEHTLLFDMRTTDILGIPYERQIKVLGSDLSDEMYAQISRSIPFVLHDGTRIKRDIVVLEDDYFNLRAINGIDVDGLIGGEFFKGLTVQINYDKSRLELYNPEKYKPCNDCTTHDIQIINHKPYVLVDYVSSSKTTSDTSKLKLLLDSGAAITYLLFMESDSSIVIPKTSIPGSLGKGLGGDILGLVGKSRYIGLDNYGFHEVITYYQSIDSAIVANNKIDRHGLIGNTVLSRFKKVAIDYTYERLYLEPHKDYNKEFQYDKSGINLIALGPNLAQYYVNTVLIDSPAYECGIRPGDLIIKYGWWSTNWFSLQGLTSRLCKKEGKEIKLTIKRGEEKLKKSFILRDLLK